jgi:hypothetical protein
MTVKIVGLDLAKDVFQVYGISQTGRKVFTKKIKCAKLLAFFETLPRCLFPWKHGALPIIGVASWDMIRSMLREFGHILPKGIKEVSAFARKHGTEDQSATPEVADGILGLMCNQLLGLNVRVDQVD